MFQVKSVQRLELKTFHVGRNTFSPTSCKICTTSSCFKHNRWYLHSPDFATISWNVENNQDIRFQHQFWSSGRIKQQLGQSIAKKFESSPLWDFLLRVTLHAFSPLASLKSIATWIISTEWETNLWVKWKQTNIVKPEAVRVDDEHLSPLYSLFFLLSDLWKCQCICCCREICLYDRKGKVTKKNIWNNAGQSKPTVWSHWKLSILIFQNVLQN